MQPPSQPTQNLLTTVPPVTAVPVATVIPSVITSRSDTNTPVQIESQENASEVCINYIQVVNFSTCKEHF